MWRSARARAGFRPAGRMFCDADAQIGRACGIRSSGQAFVLSVTVGPRASMGYLTLWPQGQARPVVATLNALDAAITSNMSIVSTTNGSISAFASNPTHLIIDISGYFAQ